MRNNGVDFEKRKEILGEKIRVIQEIWSQDKAEFKGEYLEFEALYSWPKPVQRPRPPLLIGAAAVPRTWRDIAQWGDGWMPTRLRAEGEELGRHIETMRRYAEEAGRDPASLQVSLIHLSLERAQGREETVEEFISMFPSAQLIDMYEGFGIDRIILAPPVGTMEQARRAFDAVASELIATS